MPALQWPLPLLQHVALLLLGLLAVAEASTACSLEVFQTVLYTHRIRSIGNNRISTPQRHTFRRSHGQTRQCKQSGRMFLPRSVSKSILLFTIRDGSWPAVRRLGEVVWYWGNRDINKVNEERECNCKSFVNTFILNRKWYRDVRKIHAQTEQFMRHCKYFVTFVCERVHIRVKILYCILDEEDLLEAYPS